MRAHVSSIMVALADKNAARGAICRGLLRATRGVRLIGEAQTDVLLGHFMSARPHVLLLDMKLCRQSLLPIIREKSPRTKIILLVNRASRKQILRALCLGARGYLDRSAIRPFLLKAVRNVHAGECWVTRAMVGHLLDLLRRLAARRSDPT